MSLRRRLMRTARAVLTVAAAAVGWVILAILYSQFLMRGPVPAIVASIAAVLLAIVAAGCIRALRAVRARRVIVYLGQAVRLGLPLPQFLRAAAASERWPVAGKLARLADSIEGAARLGDALRNEVPELPLRDAGIVRVAVENDALGPALARLAAERQDGVDAAFRRRFPWVYLAALLVMLPLACTMLAVFVLPKWAQIMRDFHVPVPPWIPVVRRLDVTLALGSGAAVLLGATILLALLAASFRWIAFARHDFAHPLRLPAERVAWHLPAVGPMLRDRGHADLCQAIADGLAARRPADVVLAEAGMLELNASLLGRLRVWRSMVTAGRSMGQAARAAGMPALIAGLAGDLADPTGAADAFAFLARHYRARFERRQEWLAALAPPVIAIAGGAAVGTVACAMFDAMQRVIFAAMPQNLGL